MAEFGIYDISGWNANVSLEYWLARGEDLYIALDRTQRQAGGRHVPSDLGLDRFQYTTFGPWTRPQQADRWCAAAGSGFAAASAHPLAGLGPKRRRAD